MMEGVILGGLFFGTLFGVFSAVIAKNRGRNGAPWFFVGFFFGPFGLLVAALSAQDSGGGNEAGTNRAMGNNEATVPANVAAMRRNRELARIGRQAALEAGVELPPDHPSPLSEEPPHHEAPIADASRDEPKKPAGENTPEHDRTLRELIAMLADDWETADERRRGAIDYALREQLGLRGGRRLAALSARE